MSAFIVGKDHIDAMVTAGLIHGRRYQSDMTWANSEGAYDGTLKLNANTATEVGRMLWAENVASVEHRYSPAGREVYYGEHGRDMAPLEQLPCTLTEETIPGTAETMQVPEYLTEYVYRASRRVPTPVETLSIIACFEYQSCEHEGWNDSEAKRFCVALQSAAINALPGYDDAPWEWS